MPKVSDRSSEILHSPIRNLIPYARKAVKEGVEVLHLNIGQPDIPTPPLALEHLRAIDTKIIGYGASEGKSELREVVRDYYTDYVSRVTFEDIYVTTGASEAISFTLFACFDEGQEIIIPEPFYANYIGFSQVSGVNLVPVTSTIEKSFELPAIEDFEQQISSKTRAIFLCNPGNPTGCLYTKDQLNQISQLAIKHDLYLIVDEVYREFCYDEKFCSVLEIKGAEEHVVVIDSISKVFSACGARIGFVVSRNRALMKNILKYAELRLCPPMIGQEIAIACFKGRNEYLSKVRSEYDLRRKFMYRRLSEMPGVISYLPGAAFYIMTSLPIDDSEKFCKWLLTDFRYSGHTVMLAPGHGFYLNRELGRKQVRMAFVLGIDQLSIAMDCLEEALKVYSEKVMDHSLVMAHV